MIFEASFYLNRPVSPELIMAYAETFGGRLNRMTITDAYLRSRSWRPDPGRMAEALAADFLPAHILLFQKGKDENHSFPERTLQLIRKSDAEDEDRIFSLVANVPAEDEQAVAVSWWALAAESGAKAGHGYLQQWPILQINYGMFATSAPDVRTLTWEAFNASCDRLVFEQPSFSPVLEGTMLRNVLRQNFMTASLAEAVKDVLKEAGLPIDGFASSPGDRVVWTLPGPEAQRVAHGALHPKGLVWENDWFDLAGYRPVPPRSGRWPGGQRLIEAVWLLGASGNRLPPAAISTV